MSVIGSIKWVCLTFGDVSIDVLKEVLNRREDKRFPRIFSCVELRNDTPCDTNQDSLAPQFLATGPFPGGIPAASAQAHRERRHQNRCDIFVVASHQERFPAGANASPSVLSCRADVQYVERSALVVAS